MVKYDRKVEELEEERAYLKQRIVEVNAGIDDEVWKTVEQVLSLKESKKWKRSGKDFVM